MQKSLKIQLSLASLLFFGPFVQYSLSKGHFSLDAKESNFVLAYAKMGWIALGIFCVSIVSAVLYYLYGRGRMDSINTGTTLLLLLFLIVGVICILTDTSLSLSHHSLSLDTDVKDTQSISLSLLLKSYTPLYNLFLRYRDHAFGTPNLIIKESIIVWILFVFAACTMTTIIPISILILILLRILTLSQGIDILGPRIQYLITSLFVKNPEEIRGKLINDTASFSYLGDIRQYFHLQLQYILFVLALFTLAYFNLLPWTNGFFLSAFVLVIGRYGLMIIEWKHVPQLPLFKEIVQGIAWIMKHLGMQRFSF